MKKLTTLRLGVVLLTTGLLLINQVNAEDYWELICPPNVTVDCDDELWDLSIYGNAYIHTYGGNIPAGSPTVHYYLNSCNTGYITRTWTAEDPNWNWISCTQTIYVGGNGSFGYHNIYWPADTEVKGCNPNTHPDITGWPDWDYVDCSMIGYSYKDWVYTVNDGCKKIMRKWTLLNWCGSNGQYPTFTYNQIIKVVNDELPQFDCPGDITVSSKNCKNAFVQADPLIVDPSVCGGHFTVTNNSPYSISKGADISGTYPIGTTKVGITVNFGCGMKRSCWVNVVVKNDKAPTPVCINHLSVALMGIDEDNDGVNERGMVDIWAKDLNWKSYSDCGFHPLKYSFSPDSIVSGKTFTCDDLGINHVKMYVIDTRGNASYCVVKVEVQNNSANITPCVRKDTTTTVVDTTKTTLYSLSGRVKDNFGKAVTSVEISLSDRESTTKDLIVRDTSVILKKDSFINYSGYVLYFFEYDTVITEEVKTVTVSGAEFSAVPDSAGKYVFKSAMEQNRSYLLKSVLKNAEHTGVNKKDLDALTDYILGNYAFTTHAQFQAADLNDDGVIDLADLNLMIEFIRGDIQTFGNNDVEIYLEKADYLSNPIRVLEKPEDCTVFDSIAASIENADFTLVRKGDIVEGNNLKGEYVNLEVRSAEDYLHARSAVLVHTSPNPFKDRVNFTLTTPKDDVALVQISDLTGRIIFSDRVILHRGSNEYPVQLFDASGNLLMYSIRISDRVYSGKLVRLD